MVEESGGAAAGRNEWLLEEMRERYLDSPRSVSDEWRRFFEGNGAPASPGPGPPAPPPPPPA